ncbi:MAG: transcriptional regulator np20 [Rhizobium sp.]|nr:transcriptional regulator np20 [Rhizobium sp.]
MPMAGHLSHETLQPPALDAISALSRAAALCKKRGVQWTAIRKALLWALLESERPIPVSPLLRRLRELVGRNVLPPTLYRCLDFLIVQGFAQKISTSNAYVALRHADQSPQVMFLLCDSCGTSIEVPNCAVERHVTDAAQQREFDVHKITIEIHGVCRSCRAYSKVH